MRPASLALALVLTPFASADEDQLSFSSPIELSAEVPGGASPGEQAAKGKLARLVKTTGGALDGRLVSVYADAANHDLVWKPRGAEHHPRDIFARYSDDDGVTWSDPVNVSNTANSFSRLTDWDGDGLTEAYWGDSEKPNIFSSGNIIVVSWVDPYMPAHDWGWSQVGDNPAQGVASYPDIAVYPEQHEVPYHGTYAAISYDGGSTWAFGAEAPPLQLTYGMRDGKQDVVRGAGKRWILTWQEDPEGLQTGDADGPGEGSSGAKVSNGTDVWYTWTPDIVADPMALRTNRTPLSNQSEYDKTQPGDYPLTGTGGHKNDGAGSIENHGCSRANLHIINDAEVFHAIAAYEETKGIPDVIDGKTIQYHYFPYDAPTVNGSAEAAHGDAGTTLSDFLENSRRVRFARQTPNGSNPAIAIFWRQGIGDHGAPSDIMLKVSTTFAPADLAATPALNLSTNTPASSAGDLDLPTGDNPIEDANAHRAILRGSFLAVGWDYTWNGPLARYTDLANYNFWVRRSFDGGATWDSPQNLSGVTDTTVTVREPRLVQPASTGSQDDMVFVAAWGTTTNVYEGIGVSEPLDTQIVRTTNRGDTYEKVLDLAAGMAAEQESQVRVNDDASRVYAVVMSNDGGVSDARYLTGRVVTVPETVGVLFGFGDGTGAFCPCGNEIPTGSGAGCGNSTGQGGLLIASGSDSITADDLVLEASGLPVETYAVPFVGTAYGDLGQGAPVGDGLLCIGGSTKRLDIALSDGAGSIVWPSGLSDSLGVVAGQSRMFQIVYRDGQGPCGSGVNVTNGLKVTFKP